MDARFGRGVAAAALVLAALSLGAAQAQGVYKSPGPAHNRRASPLAAMTQDEARADSNFLSESDR